MDGVRIQIGCEGRVHEGELIAIAQLAELHTAAQPLEHALTQIARLAADAVAGAEGAGIALLTGRHPTVVASTELVRTVDDVQFDIGEGPCITALRERRTVRSGSLGGDPTWPHFGPRAGRLGLHSALSVPLQLADHVVAVVDVYARAKDAFDDEAVRRGERFARPAAVSVDNVRVLAETRKHVEQLQAALTSRPTIDHAVGILMGRTGGDADEAFARLRAMSQQQGRRIADLAVEITAGATRRRRRRGP